LAESQPGRRRAADSAFFVYFRELRDPTGLGVLKVNSVLSVALAPLRQMVALAACITCAWGCGQNSTPVTASHEENRGATASQSTAAELRYDLSRDEVRGGHTLRKHVGQTDAQLAERLRHERNISAASTWTELETAEETVAEALASNGGRIDNWIRRGYPRANLALHYNARRVIGRSLARGEDRAVDCTSAVVVLRADRPDSYYVLTTYPEARE